MDSETKDIRATLRQSAWRKSSRSGPNCDNCVEVAPLVAGAAVRDSKDAEGPLLVFPAAAWQEFVRTLR